MTLDQVARGRPPLEGLAEQALYVWNFCGGWKPELFPAAFEFYGIEQASLVTGLLLDMRDYLRKHSEAQAAKSRPADLPG